MYADALLDQGDPWGEVIRLQVAAESRALSADEFALLKARIDAHAADFLGPAAAIARNCTFRRGFLESCVVIGASERENWNALKSPVWQTLREVTVAPGRLRMFELVAKSKHLRAVHGIQRESELEVLQFVAGDRLEALTLEDALFSWELQEWSERTPLGPFPKLRHVTMPLQADYLLSDFGELDTLVLLETATAEGTGPAAGAALLGRYASRSELVVLEWSDADEPLVRVWNRMDDATDRTHCEVELLEPGSAVANETAAHVFRELGPFPVRRVVVPEAWRTSPFGPPTVNAAEEFCRSWNVPYAESAVIPGRPR